MIVSAPASSANLGPGFDCLALALDLPFDLSDELVDGYHAAEPTHPAVAAFVAAGGDPAISLWWRSPIPPGRGLGFSGAARVAGAYLAGLLDGIDAPSARGGAFVVAAELEGHPDNAAASAYGGFTVAAGEHVVSMAVADPLSVVVWSPAESTSTDASRRVLAPTVDRADAAFSIGRAALWVAALAAGDLGALRTACEDRLHQDARLATRPDASAALDAFLGQPQVLAAWLSGSGPSVAALVQADESTGELADVLPHEGRLRLLSVDREGVRAH